MTTTPTARVSRLLTPGISAGATCAGLPLGLEEGEVSRFSEPAGSVKSTYKQLRMFPTTAVASPRSLAGVGRTEGTARGQPRFRRERAQINLRVSHRPVQSGQRSAQSRLVVSGCGKRSCG